MLSANLKKMRENPKPHASRAPSPNPPNPKLAPIPSPSPPAPLAVDGAPGLNPSGSVAVSSSSVPASFNGLEEGEVAELNQALHGLSHAEEARLFWQQKRKANRAVEAGIELSFEPTLVGSGRIKVPPTQWAESVDEWINSLVGIVFGNKPALGRMQGFVRTKWGLGSGVQTSLLQPGIFLFTFDSSSDRDKILDSGPWTFDSRPLVLRQWSPKELYSLESVASLPLWVKFPGLGPHLRRPDILSLIASSVGKPIRTDGFTAQKEKMAYARVLIEVYAANEFKRTVEIEALDGTCFVQKIEYDWTPPRCSHCLSFGHIGQQCKLPRLKVNDNEEEDDNFVLDDGGEECHPQAVIAEPSAILVPPAALAGSPRMNQVVSDIGINSIQAPQQASALSASERSVPRGY